MNSKLFSSIHRIESITAEVKRYIYRRRVFRPKFPVSIQNANNAKWKKKRKRKKMKETYFDFVVGSSGYFGDEKQIGE